MPTIKGKCSSCGALIETQAQVPFLRAEVATAFCPACTEQQFRDQGGAVVFIRGELEASRFRVGKVTITAGAVAALEASSQHATEFLGRHARGDWGAYGNCPTVALTDDEHRRGWEATEDTAKINKSNLLNSRDDIMSEYTTSRGTRLWIITSLNGSGATTVLLPEEY